MLEKDELAEIGHTDPKEAADKENYQEINQKLTKSHVWKM